MYYKHHIVFGKVEVISHEGDIFNIKTDKGIKEVHRCMLHDTEHIGCKCKIPKGWYPENVTPSHPATYIGKPYQGFYKYDRTCDCGKKYHVYSFVYGTFDTGYFYLNEGDGDYTC